MAVVTVTGGTGVLGARWCPGCRRTGTRWRCSAAAPLPDGVRRLIGDLAVGRGLEMTVRIRHR